MSLGYRHPEYLIEPADLQRRLGEANLVILDTTTTLVPAGDGGFDLVTGRAAFEAGHIPGAHYVELEADLSQPAEGLLFTLPTRDQFAAAAKRLGIGRDSFVVLYSTAQPGWAARVWLMLKAFGFHNAALLNGGYVGWVQSGGPTAKGVAQPVRAVAEPFAWVDDTARYFVGTGTVEGTDDRLVNALSPDMFDGLGPIAYGRPGHIPGSVNIPTSSMIDPAGRYLEPEALVARFTDNGIGAEDAAIAYCGAGVAASNIVFSSHLAGHGSVRVYDGSMLEWSRDPKHRVTGVGN